MSGSAVAVLRYAIMLAVTAVVAWGLWQCQRPGQAVYGDGPVHEDGPVFVYPPSSTSVDATKHGWPAGWFVRRTTRDLSGRTPPIRTYTAFFPGLVCNLVAWISILVCTALTVWRVTWARAQFRLRTLLSAHVAVAVLLSWWSVEYGNMYVVNHPVLTEILRDAPTTPLLRLFKCPASVSVPVLGGGFCVFLQGNACLIGLFTLGKRSLSPRSWSRGSRGGKSSESELEE